MNFQRRPNCEQLWTDTSKQLRWPVWPTFQRNQLMRQSSQKIHLHVFVSCQVKTWRQRCNRQKKCPEIMTPKDSVLRLGQQTDVLSETMFNISYDPSGNKAQSIFPANSVSIVILPPYISLTSNGVKSFTNKTIPKSFRNHGVKKSKMTQKSNQGVGFPRRSLEHEWCYLENECNCTAHCNTACLASVHRE